MNFKQLLFLVLVVFVQSQMTCPSFGFFDSECNFCSNPTLQSDGAGNEHCEVICQCNNVLNEFDLTQAETECKSTTDESLWFVDQEGEVGCEIDCADGFRSQAGSLTTTTTDQTCSSCAAACAADDNCEAYSCATLRKEVGVQLVNQCQFSTVQQSFTDEVVQAQAKLLCVREWSHAPTDAPSVAPTSAPSDIPTEAPTFAPSFVPTSMPTFEPTRVPSFTPTEAPTSEPTAAPTPVTNSPTTLPSAAPAVAKAQVWEEYVEILPSAVQPYWYILLAVVFILLLCFARTLYYVCFRKQAKELTTDGELEEMASDLENQEEYVITIPPKRQTTRRHQQDTKRKPHTTTQVQETDLDVEEACSDLQE